MLAAFLSSLLALGSTVAPRDPSTAVALEAAPDSRLNFVLVLLDDAGWGDFACYGNWHVQTPNIDRLAAEGTLFTRFYVNAPVCSPSRLAFMTGQFPGRLGVHGVRWGDAQAGMGHEPREAVWLSQVLGEAGYRTGQFGKWHLGHATEGPPPGTYGIEDHRTEVSSGEGWDDRDNTWTSRSDGLIFDEALRFIEQSKGSPFYVNVWTLTPHTPIAPSEEQMNVGHYRNMKAKGLAGPLESFPTPIRQYDATITEIDRQIGRLLDRLVELDIADRTLVLVTSDNGPEHLVPRRNASVGSSDPFRGRKRSLYEGGIRVPCLAWCPSRIPAGQVRDQAWSAVDWMPTVCALAGIGGHARDGEDAAALLLGRAWERGKALFWEYRFPQGGRTAIYRSPMLAATRGDWKLLMNPDGSRVELYNLARDRMEVDNLAGQEPERVQALRGDLIGFHESLPAGPIDPQAGAVGVRWPQAK